MLKFIDLHTGRESKEGRASVLCLGNFDGVHIGHSALIEKTIEKRNELGILGGAWCFRQPPADFLLSAPLMRLTTLDEKLELFSTKGLDIAILADFEALRNTAPSVFVREVLIEKCKCQSAICGFNFRFGKNGAGRPSDLVGFAHGSLTVDPVVLDGKTVSSTAIREHLINGDAETAARMLGEPYSVSGKIGHGRALGKKLGMPTINLAFDGGKLIPRLGVYSSKVTLDGKEYISVSNIGRNPTVGGNEIRCETHIIDFDREIYGKDVKVSLYHHLRGEKHFESTDALVNAVMNDIESTKNYFK